MLTASAALPELPGCTVSAQLQPFRNSIHRSPARCLCQSLATMRGIGSATVERIYHQFTVRKASERMSLDCPAYLGIDEHTLHKGQRFLLPPI